MKNGVMTELELGVFNYLKDNGGKISIDEMAEALGRTTRSIGANVTALAKEENGGLVIREKVTVEGQEKPVTYVVLTEAGKAFTPAPAQA